MGFIWRSKKQGEKLWLLVSSALTWIRIWSYNLMFHNFRGRGWTPLFQEDLVRNVSAAGRVMNPDRPSLKRTGKKFPLDFIFPDAPLGAVWWLLILWGWGTNPLWFGSVGWAAGSWLWERKGIAVLLLLCGFSKLELRAFSRQGITGRIIH